MQSFSRDSASLGPKNGHVLVVVALGHELPGTLDGAISGLGGFGRLLPFPLVETVVVTAELSADAPASAAGRLLVEKLWHEGRAARTVTPLQGPRAALRAITGRDDWQTVDVGTSGARFEQIAVRAEVIGTAHVGVGRIGSASDRAPLAIGLWQYYVHPRLAIPARLSGDRAPLLADLATPFRPSLLVLIGNLQGYVVTVATADLVAAELVGLALRFATTESELRPRPWEDRVVQRATELDLGVRLPRQIDLAVVTAGGVQRGEAVERVIRQLHETLGLVAEPDPS